MNREELNHIIEHDYEYPVFVSELVYPEIEELYLSSDRISKTQLAAFFQRFDYQGVRNALEIARHIEEFKKDVTLYHKYDVSPSQITYLKTIGWNVEKFAFVKSFPWLAK